MDACREASSAEVGRTSRVQVCLLSLIPHRLFDVYNKKQGHVLAFQIKTNL